MRLSFFVLLLLLSLPGFSQDSTKTDYKREEIINGKRYRVYENWVNFGVGGAYHSQNPRTQLVLGAEINFHLQKTYFSIGGSVSGDHYKAWNNHEAHVGWVALRRNAMHHHLAAIIGGSFSESYRFLYAGHYYSEREHAFGLYGQLQLVRKLDYTIGPGMTFFVNANANHTLIGLRLDFYLSDAYRGAAQPGRR